MRSTRACARSPRAACPTISASSASAATAATSPTRWRCSRAGACAATQRSHPAVGGALGAVQPGAGRARAATAAGTAGWTARSGCSTAAAACSARNRGAMSWPSAWPLSTSIPAGRCGAAAHCVRSDAAQRLEEAALADDDGHGAARRDSKPQACSQERRATAAAAASAGMGVAGRGCPAAGFQPAAGRLRDGGAGRSWALHPTVHEVAMTVRRKAQDRHWLSRDGGV